MDFEKALDSISFAFIMTTLELFDLGENFKEWIKIILGMQEGTNFNAVTVVNGNISKPLELQRGCRQGDPIAGYLFIMAIEILALMLKHSKCKSYMANSGTSHLLDIYTEDLEMKQNKDLKNLKNVAKETYSNRDPFEGLVRTLP